MSQATSPPRIDEERLKQFLDGINRFGRSETGGGFDRPGFSDADMAARRWLGETMAAEGLCVAHDAVGNVSGVLGDTDAAPIMLGSHLDTVPQGGAFDGALGVAVALECALAIRDAGTEIRHPLEVVATAEEEGRFGGMLGAQALCGLVDRDWMERAVDADGVRLWEAMEAQGLDPAAVALAARAPGSVRAFLELHIEQGPVLQAAGRPVGIADGVSGVLNLAVTLEGRANHSGTTPMDMRADAFAGLAAIGAAVPHVIAADGGDQSRITIGKVELRPNFPHTVPGRADFSVVIRDTDATRIDLLRASFEAVCIEVARRHGLEISLVERSAIAPVDLSPGLVQLLGEEAESAGLDFMVMPSGAGHDAQTMQHLCPSGLVFVPSRGGISHAPEECSEWDDILDGARLMLAATTRLAMEEAQD